MAFDIMSIRTNRRNNDARPPVQAALYLRTSLPPQIEITLARSIIERLAWQPGETRLAVLEGTDADRNLIQLKPDKAGVMFSKQGGNTKNSQNAVVRLSTINFRHHKFVNERIPLREVNAQAFGSTLTVDLTDFVEKGE